MKTLTEPVVFTTEIPPGPPDGVRTYVQSVSVTTIEDLYPAYPPTRDGDPMVAPSKASCRSILYIPLEPRLTLGLTGPPAVDDQPPEVAPPKRSKFSQVLGFIRRIFSPIRIRKS